MACAPAPVPANNGMVVTPKEFQEWKRRVAVARDRAIALGVEDAWEAARKEHARAGKLPPDAAEAALGDVSQLADLVAGT